MCGQLEYVYWECITSVRANVNSLPLTDSDTNGGGVGWVHEGVVEPNKLSRG